MKVAIQVFILKRQSRYCLNKYFLNLDIFNKNHEGKKRGLKKFFQRKKSGEFPLQLPFFLYLFFQSYLA